MDLKNIKSWHIALFAVAVNIVFMSWHFFGRCGFDCASLYTKFSLGSIFISTIFLLIPTLFLRNVKTKKIGAIVSILLGVTRFFAYENELFISGVIQGFLLITAALYYLWKKV
ncbi:MAG: hypothetical protein KAJ47_01935 [Candidatus Aenigmarchaeota archaeon]|nr:hypothetical protein [Candidatus Aenigmarchaeota archaeon]